MKKLFYFGMGLLLCLSAAIWTGCKDKEEEQPGAVYGVVTDKETGQPIKSAGVELQPIGLRTVTGTDGQYGFTDLAAGTYKLYITRSGYADNLIDKVVVKSGQTTQFDAQLGILLPSLWIVNEKGVDLADLDFDEDTIDELDFGAEANDVQRSFYIFNNSMRVLQWQITTTADWVREVSRENGTLSAGQSQYITITIYRGKLEVGDNVTTINITSNAGNYQLKLKAQNPPIPEDPEVSYVTIPELNLMVQTADRSGEFTWEQARIACAQSTVGGYTDWRLPTEEELAGLCERKSEIGGFGQEVYWAGTIEDGNYNFHQLVNFSEGKNCFQGWARNDYLYRVRAVRTITE